MQTKKTLFVVKRETRLYLLALWFYGFRLGRGDRNMFFFHVSDIGSVDLFIA